MPRLRHALVILFLPAALAAVACSRSAPAPADATASKESETRAYQQQAGYPQQPPPSATSTAPGQLRPNSSVPDFAEPPASDIPGLQAQLDRAEQALLAALPPAGSDSLKTAQKTPPNAGTPGSPAEASQADPCLVACAALASMKRSADHVCGMAGERDASCGGARERVQRAEQRVVQACPACAGK